MSTPVIVLLFVIVTILIAILFFYSRSKFKEQDKKIDYKINEVEKKNITISSALREQIEGYKNYTNERIKEYKDDTDKIVQRSFDNIEKFLKRIEQNHDSEEEARNNWVKEQERSNKSRDSKINAINNDVTSIKTMIGVVTGTKELDALKKVIKEASQESLKKIIDEVDK